MKIFQSNLTRKHQKRQVAVFTVCRLYSMWWYEKHHVCMRILIHFFWNVVPSVMPNTRKKTATTTKTTTQNITRKLKLRAILKTFTNVFSGCVWVFVYLLRVCDDDEPHILSIRINFGIWIECAVIVSNEI